MANFLGLVLCVLWLSIPSAALGAGIGFKLTANDGMTHDNLGASVSQDGSTLAATAPGPNPPSAGAVYIWIRAGNSWSLQQKLSVGQGFGSSIKLVGDTLIVGGASNGVEQGAVYIFTRSANVWSLQQKLMSSDSSGADNFGFAVDFYGDQLVVGAPEASVGSNFNQGAVYVYTKSANIWTLQQKLTANDGGVTDFFGRSVAVHNNLILVGSYGNNSFQGAAYIFSFNGTTWTQQQKLTANDGSGGDDLGYAVALSEDTAVVGAVLDSIDSKVAQGAAYVFKRTLNAWTQQQKLVASDGQSYGLFGLALALEGNQLAISAIGDNNFQGAVYLFNQGQNGWNQQDKLQASDGASFDFLGSGLALNRGRVTLGSSYTDVGSNINQGALYIFDPQPILTSFSPTLATVGQTITLQGSGFTGATQVQVNGFGGPFTLNSDNQMMLTVVPGMSTGPITITIPSGILTSVDHLTVQPLALRSTGWQLVGARDFNGDGAPDLIWRNYSSGANQLWLMNGFTYIQTVNLPAQTNLNWQLVGANDLTGDKKADLLWRNYITGENQVWQMNGSTFTQILPLLTVSDLRWQLITAQDFTQDGQPDLLWRYTTGDNAIWQMNGITYVQAFYLLPVSDPTWQLVDAQDFTQDQIPDLLWRNYQTGDNALWQMQGINYSQATFLPAVVDPSWQLIAAQDFTQDGQPDLLWYNLSSGEIYIWQMNGLAYVQSLFIGNRPSV